ncbi:MAG: hypothetical protein LBV20_05340 [Treponema sp.]|jgi:hypothetical protein|nr:hypothetical protein [Treponema sp.]
MIDKTAWKVAKINLQNLRSAYIKVGVLIAIMLIQTLVYIILSVVNEKTYDNSTVSIGCFFWLLPLISTRFIPLSHFRKTINLGAKRNNFFWGILIVYALLVFFASLVNTILYYTFDRFIQSGGFFNDYMFHGVMNLVEIFGWTNNGIIIGFMQQFAFLFFATIFFHTLIAMQDKWYGWVTDVLLIAIISVFTPIASLRAVLASFFNLIIFQPNAFFQIAACLVLSMGIYALNKIIFARKII